MGTRPCTRVRLDRATTPAYTVACQTSSGGYAETVRGHWVQLVGTGAVTVLSTCGNTTAAPALRLFTACTTDGARVADTCVLERTAAGGCTDPRLRGTELRFYADAGQRYHVLVTLDDDDDDAGVPGAGGGGEATLCAHVDAEAVAHDTPATAVVVGALPYAAFGTAQTSRRGPDVCGSGAGVRGVWYNFTGTGGLVAVDTCGYFVADTVLAVVAADGACLAASDDACGVQSAVTLATVAGRTYSAFVRLARDTYDKFTVAITPLAVPPHSTCDTALQMNELPYYFQGSLAGFAPEATPCSSSSSSSSSSAPSSSSSSSSASSSSSSSEGVPGMWFALPAISDPVLVSTCGSGAGTATALELYSAGAGACSEATHRVGAQCVQTSTDDCGANAALLVAPRTPPPADGYLLRVAARTPGAAPNFTLTVTPVHTAANARCTHAAPAAPLPAHLEGNFADHAGTLSAESCTGTAQARVGHWFAHTTDDGATTAALRLSTCNAHTTAAVAIEVYDACGATTCVARADHDAARGCTELNYTAAPGARTLFFVTPSESNESSESDESDDGGNGDKYFELDVVANREAPNAHCSSATAVTALPFFDTGETVTGAPTHSRCTNTTRRGVWYTLTGAGEKVAVSTCTAVTEFATRVEVHRGGCGAAAVCVPAQTDVATECGADAYVQFFAERGVQYHVLVAGTSAREQGVFGVRFASMAIPRASVCAAGTPVAGDGFVARGATQYARVSRSTCSAAHDLCKGVWYTYHAPRRARVLLDTCDAHTTFETHLEVYRACTRTPVGGDGCVATQPHRVCTHQDTVSFVAERGQTYHILVTGRDTTPLLDTGFFRLAVNVTELPSVSSSSSLPSSSSEHGSHGGGGGCRTPGQVAAIVIFGVLLPAALLAAVGVWGYRRFCRGAGGAGGGGLLLHRYRAVGATDADSSDYQAVTL